MIAVRVIQSDAILERVPADEVSDVTFSALVGPEVEKTSGSMGGSLIGNDALSVGLDGGSSVGLEEGSSLGLEEGSSVGLLVGSGEGTRINMDTLIPSL